MGKRFLEKIVQPHTKYTHFEADGARQPWTFGEKTQKGSLRPFFTCRFLDHFSADRNKIEHRQSVGVREQCRRVGILKFGRVATEIWKCRLWGTRVMLLKPGPMKILIILTYEFFTHLGTFELLLVSMKTVKSEFLSADTWKLMWVKGKGSRINCFMFSLTECAWSKICLCFSYLL